MHKHLRRLDRVWIADPIFFITSCTRHRCEWQDAQRRHGWSIGRFVIMPDHVHFFCAPNHDSKALSTFVGFWKEWTSKRLERALNLKHHLWQEEFFDHVLRSDESYRAKWEYVCVNPVRAGLVSQLEDWPWQGDIGPL